MGIFKTRKRILERYFWPGMTQDISNHVKSCVTCQTTKTHSKYPRAYLKPLPQEELPNHRVHMDLFGPLSTSDSGKNGFW